MGASCSKAEGTQPRTKKPRARGNGRQVSRSTTPQQQQHASRSQRRQSDSELQFTSVVSSQGDSCHRKPEKNHRSVAVPIVGCQQRGQRNPLHPVVVMPTHSNINENRTQDASSRHSPRSTQTTSRGSAAPHRNNSHSSDPHSSATDSFYRNRDDSCHKESFSVPSRFSSTYLESGAESRAPSVPGEAFDRPPQLQRFISAENTPDGRPLQPESSAMMPRFIDLAGSKANSTTSNNRALVRMAHLDAFGDDDSFQTGAPSIDEAVIAGLRGDENESESNSSTQSELTTTKSTLSCAQTRTPSLRSSTITDTAPSQVEPSPGARAHSTSDSNPLGSPRTRLSSKFLSGKLSADAESMVSALVPVD